MYWENYPNEWFWIISHSLLLITLITATVSIYKTRMKYLSMLAIFFTITIPIIFTISCMERLLGMNEVEYFVDQLQQAAVWTIFIILGCLFLLIWWVIFFVKLINTRWK